MSAKEEYGARAYTVAWLLILLLTFLAFVFTKWVLSGTAALVVALSLAAINALLLVLVLMNLARQRVSAQVVLLLPATLLGILIVLVMLDVATRHVFPPRPVVPESSTRRPPPMSPKE